jgi:inosine-uridine nucleoside N-ribohydrolase
MRVDIETVSPLSAGQTVCDIWHQSRLPKNCRVATSMDVPAFWKLMLGALQRANEWSPLGADARGAQMTRRASAH